MASPCVLGPQTARAASLVFQAVATPATSICAAPCYQVRMFIEDPTRNLDVQAIQVEVWVEGAIVPVLPSYPNTNQSAGNTLRVSADGEGLAGFPWNLTSSVNRTDYWNSAASAPFTVDSLQAQVEAFNASCIPATLCQIQEAGLAANRIFFGRFNIRNPGAAPAVRLGFMAGNGVAVADPELGVLRLSGQTLPIQFDTPEPAAPLLIGAALAALLLSRARMRRLVILLVIGVGSFARPALSAPVTWRFDGFVTVIGTILVDHGVRVGNPVHGSLTFNPELAADQSCFTGFSEFSCTYSVPASMSVSIRDHSIEASGAAELLLRDFFAPVTSFQFAADEFTYDGSAPPAASSAIFTIAASPTVYPSDLPASELPVPEVDGQLDLLALQFQEEVNGPAAGFQAIIVSLQVPEPRAGALLLVAVAVIGIARQAFLSKRLLRPASPPACRYTMAP